jgi:uracil-DNA glycosylase family 4
MDGFFSTSTLISTKQRTSGLARCGSCGLYKKCTTPKMQVIGQGRKKILIVTETPTEVEDKKGIPLSDKSGKLLRRLFQDLGINIYKDCWKTSAVICYSPTVPSNEKIQACSANLFKTIEKLQPTCIILMGGVAVQSLIGTIRNETIKNRSIYMGFQIPSRKPNVWICPTYHPSYLLREEDSLLERITKEHLRIAIQKAKQVPWKTVPDYKKRIDILINKPKQVCSFIDTIIRTKKMIAFDYETNALKPEYNDTQIHSCSVGDDKQVIAFPWTESVQDTMLKLLKSPVGKIAANLKFEDRWTRTKLRINIRNWAWDTMQAAHILDNRRGITGLKFQVYVQFGIEDYNSHLESLLTTTNKKRINLIHEIDMHDLLLYNGLDSLLEYKLAIKQMKMMGVGL